MTRLENWSCSLYTDDDGYKPPEARTLHLHGTVYGHPHKPDGSNVRTSSVVEVDGRTVTTFSGTVYHLGAIDPQYLAYLAENEIPYDHEAPIRVRRAYDRRSA